MKTPTTLFEAVTYFSDNANCVEFVKSICWKDGKAACPRCESSDCILMVKQQKWMCRECRKQFSIKYNTIFEASPIPLSKWLVSMYLITNAKNGISSHELSRSIGVSQKSCWFMLHRIREAMRTGTFTKLRGTVEVDETFIGGKEANKHISKNKFKKAGTMDKTVVFGMLERGGEVRAKVVDSRKRKILDPEIRANVEAGSSLYSDSLHSYKSLANDYNHDWVDHKRTYVKGDVHTNTVEGFWSLLKRSLKGTWIHVEDFHLDRYLDEQCFRYNLRKGDDANRFEVALSRISGRRLTWNELTSL